MYGMLHVEILFGHRKDPCSWIGIVWRLALVSVVDIVGYGGSGMYMG